MRVPAARRCVYVMYALHWTTATAAHCAVCSLLSAVCSPRRWSAIRMQRMDRHNNEICIPDNDDDDDDDEDASF